jgi:hypothetical protein
MKERLKGNRSKISVLKDLALFASRMIITKGGKIGIVVYYSKSFTLLNLTNDFSLVQQTIEKLRAFGEGSQLGEGISEIVRTFRGTPIYFGNIIIIGDNRVDNYPPLDLVLLSARSIGFNKIYFCPLGGSLGEELMKILKDNNVYVNPAATYEEAMNCVNYIVSNIFKELGNH